ncbi:MAG: hypothetical protein ACI8RZ_004197 [Myxococcota bacterium]|jgi:hypothetical protein
MQRSFILMMAALVATGCKDKDGEVTDSGLDETTPVEQDWSLLVSGPTTGTAGESLTWEATAQTDDGTPVDATISVLITDDGGTVAAEALTATLTAQGDYTVAVTAEWDGETRTDGLDLSIDPGDLSALELTLSGESAEIGDTVTATVTGADAWGNPLDVDPTLSIDPADGAGLLGFAATFTADGAYTFTAEADGLTATAGPVIVDGAGPLVALISPLRGAWIDGDSVVVEGTVTDAVSAIAGLTLNEDVVSVSADGSFSHTLDLTAGPNRLSFAATDTDGNASDAIIGVIAGSFSSDDLLGAIEAHLNQGGLDTIAEALVDELDIGAIESDLIAGNPVATDSIGCVDIEVDVDSLDLDTPIAEVTPTADGLILTLTAADLDIDLDIAVDLCGWSSTSTDGALTADEVEIVVEVDITVDGPGDVSATVTDTTVTFTNFDEDFGTLSSLLSTFGYSLSSLGIDTEGIVEDALVDAVEDTVPGALEDALESVSIDTTLDLLSAEANLFAEIGDIESTTDGLTLLLDAEVSSSGGTHADIPPHPGSLILGGEAPDYDSDPGLFLGLSLDALNRILEQLWTSGGVNTTITSAELGLEAAVIELVFPGNTTLTLRLYPQLPPVLVPSTGKEPMVLDISELQVEIWGDSDTSAPLTTAAIHLSAGATPILDGSLASPTIALDIAEADLTLDIITEDAASVGGDESLEGLLALATGGLAAELLPEISFELPDMGGFELAAEDITTAGDDGDWIVVAAELEASGPR